MVEEYSNQPAWQKWLAYLVVGGLVYGGVYYYWLKPKGAYTTTPPAENVMTPSTAPVVGKEMTVVMGEENASGESGTAKLVEEGGKVTVMVKLSGYPTDSAPQPAHIHVGACPGVGAVKYPLTSLVNGVSTTTLDVTLDALKAELPLAINVHKSAADVKVYTACGALE